MERQVEPWLCNMFYEGLSTVLGSSVQPLKGSDKADVFGEMWQVALESLDMLFYYFRKVSSPSQNPDCTASYSSFLGFCSSVGEADGCSKEKAWSSPLGIRVFPSLVGHACSVTCLLES